MIYKTRIANFFSLIESFDDINLVIPELDVLIRLERAGAATSMP